ncbi:MAG: Mg-chelatase subunit ChlD [Kiritimatiellia bacterium]|jgi:Mg-chelatase subunit ChlD
MTTPFGILSLEQPIWLWALLVIVPLAASLWFTRQKLSRWRWITASTARLLLLFCIVLALSGLSTRIPADAVGVVFIVDTSASVGSEGQRKALELINEAIQHKHPKDSVGVVTFGASAMVEAAPRDEMILHALETHPSPHHSDLAAGIRLATAILPPDHTRRLVLISDGEQTRGDAASQVLLTAGDDLKMSTYTLPARTGPEVMVDDILMPSRIDEGAPYEVRVVARSRQPVDATLRLYRNDAYLGERPVHLDGGSAEVLSVLQHAPEPGLYRYRATLSVSDPSLDTIPQNNEVVGTIQVRGRPRILYVEGYPNQARFLAGALRKEGLTVDVTTADKVPESLTGLRPYAAVILSDVPAYMLTNRQMEAMEAYVRDLGRGFMMLGGDQSFGVGGYYKTPIERLLPVHMDIRDKTRFPKLGMMLAIDKSCSMGGGSGSKLGMAKEAAIMTTELMDEDDILGVVGFDNAASWIVRPTELSNKDAIRDQIASVRTGGGTDIYPALEASIKALDESDAALKHVILLSDGVTAGADFKTLLKGANARDITITTLAFGSDADRATMEDMASWGGGHYYLVTDPSSIPAIFTRETLLASRSFLIEATFRPRPKHKSDLLEGLTEAQLPKLHGFVATQAKDRAVVALEVPPEKEGEKPSPLLAHWRFGLGRSVAFTSDVKARWAKDWIGTPEYTQTWTQIARWLVGDAEGQDLDVHAEIRDGELIVAVDAYDEDGDFRNFLDGTARVVAPDMTSHPLELRQVGPGRYEATTVVDQDGSWLVGVALSKNGVMVGRAVAEAVQPWSPEYSMLGGGQARMAELARLGGGGEILDPKTIFERPEQPRMVPEPLWPHLMWIAAVLLLLDIALRRLELTSTSLGSSSLVSATSQVPVRSRTKRGTRPEAPSRKGTPNPDVEDQPLPEPELPPDLPTSKQPKSDQPKPESYAGRLLAARKRASRKMGDEDDE